MEKRSMARSNVVVLTALAVVSVAMLQTAYADEDEIPFGEAEVFFELNDTDGDLGIHSSIDGEGWQRLRIEDPRERTMLDIRPRGRLRRQGLTQLFFESTEPPFDELAPDVFFRLFPEGVYEVSGKTLQGEEMESEATVTHAMPAPPGNLTVNGAPLPEDCDDGPVPVVLAGQEILVEWDPVETTHEELGQSAEITRHRNRPLSGLRGPRRFRPERRPGSVGHGPVDSRRLAGTWYREGGDSRARGESQSDRNRELLRGAMTP